MARQKLSGIYQIDSIIHPDRFYIGSSLDLFLRWKIHLGRLRKNIHHSKILQHHFNKYGESDLCFSILFYCDIKDLFKYEQILLDFFDPYLNVFKTAGSALGMIYGEETRERNRRAAMGRIKSPAECKAISERMKGTHYKKGKKCSLETRLKMSLSQTGIKHTEERNKKKSKMMKGHSTSEETKRKIGEANKLRWAERKAKQTLTNIP